MGEKEKTIQFQVLACPYCEGRSKLERQICPECQGLGVVAWNGSYLLYWGKELNPLQLTREKIENLVKNIINASLLIFGVIGLFALGYFLATTKIFFWDIYKFRNLQLFIFWLSLLGDGYLFYRFQKELEKIKYIPKKEYQVSVPIFQPIVWEEVKKLKKNQKLDVSNFFNAEALAAINKAWQLTNKYQQVETKPIHLLISLLTFEQINIIFSRLGVSFETLKSRVARILAKQPPWAGATTVISPEVYEIIFNSYNISWQYRQARVELSELLESLALQKNEVQELLYELNVTSDKIKNVIAWIRIRKQLQENWRRFQHRAALRPKSPINRAMTAIATPVLDAFSQDLTRLAQLGYLLPCVGRDKEIEEIFRIMQGGTRRGVILVGKPGVGRTTVIEGIAQRMVEENVPKFLQDKRLASLSIAKLVSGATPTEANQRLMVMLNEIQRSGNIILFISEIHNMVGITVGRQGSIDLSGVLAQALANNNILCLATTTPADYSHYIEGKSPLENTLEKIDIKEVSGNEAIQILEAKGGSIEYQNQVYFSYDAIAETVRLSDRYLHDRYLPEKAIEVLQEVATQTREKKGKNSLVTANDVAITISGKTNIPLTEITKEESERLLNLEEKIHQRVIDQEEAVKMVAASLRRARAEMRDTNRPIANLLFLGPTGVGKTELAKTVAEVYFGDEKNMIRLDMSEYQEKSSINRLLGLAEGGGYLTEAVRKNPFSLILLDEIEKAHPDILNVFLQVMDDGRLTDGTGRTVDFTNIILIATSNAATSFIQERINANLSLIKIKEQLMGGELNKYFRPEFLNRFDGIILFKPLTIIEVREIAKLMLKKVRDNLEKRGIGLKVTQPALTELSQAGFDPQFGARPLRRIIQERVDDSLANYLIANKIDRRDTVILEGGGKIIIEKAKEI